MTARLPSFRLRAARISKLVAVAVAAISITVPATAQASYSVPKFFLSVTASSENSVADGSSTVTFSLKHTVTHCLGETAETVQCGDEASSWTSAANYYITVTGTGNKFGGTQAKENGEQYLSGSNSFTLASTTAETKTVTVKSVPNGPPSNPVSGQVSKTVTFTAPPKPQDTTVKTPEPTASTKDSKPEAPSNIAFSIDGEQLDNTGTMRFKASEPLTVTGKAAANAIVKLFIFSTPREAQVVADAQGTWSYTVYDLEAGQHRIEATVNDPRTGAASDRTTLAKFTVLAASAKDANGSESAANSADSKTSASRLPVIILATLLLAGAAAGGWWYWRKRKKPQLTAEVVEPSASASASASDKKPPAVLPKL